MMETDILSKNDTYHAINPAYPDTDVYKRQAEKDEGELTGGKRLIFFIKMHKPKN